MAKRGPQKNPGLDREIGARIARMRRRRGFTLQVLSRLAGLHLNTVHKAENGGGATVLTLVRIAQALGVGIDQLIPVRETFVNVEKKALARNGKSAMIHDGTERLFQDSEPALGV